MTTAGLPPSPGTRDADDIAAWLRLTAAPGIGPTAAHRLLAAFGLPQQVLAQPLSTLATVIPKPLALGLLAPPGQALREAIARTVAWAAEPGHHLVTLADDAYPRRLLDLADPPPVLYITGDLATLARPSVAIVGARGATQQGLRDAESFAASLSAVGLTIVSGLALGVDAAAHAGGLRGPGSTVAVTGTGADRIYPARHKDLAHRIAAQGAILSEFPLGTPVLQHNFPRRNRLIAALAQGVLVIEAAERSGSLITARQAADLGREVFAIPGSIHAPLSRGCHLLIRQGAKLVEGPQDVLEELGTPAAALPAAPARPPAQPETADTLLAALAYDPVTPDVLCVRSGLPAEQVVARLMTLELAGAVERLPGNRYRRLA